MSAPKVQENGLVDCVVLQAFGQWFPKMRAGFSPTDAVAFKAKGLVDYAEAEETAEKPAKAPAKARVKAPATGTASPASADPIVIPEDFASLPWMTLRSLAMKIAGDAFDPALNKDGALAIVEAYLAAQKGTE